MTLFNVGDTTMWRVCQLDKQTRKMCHFVMSVTKCPHPTTMSRSTSIVIRIILQYSVCIWAEASTTSVPICGTWNQVVAKWKLLVLGNTVWEMKQSDKSQGIKAVNLWTNNHFMLILITCTVNQSFLLQKQVSSIPAKMSTDVYGFFDCKFCLPCLCISSAIVSFRNPMRLN